MAKLSYAQYLAQERTAETKHEFLCGEVWAMAGGTIEHARLAARTAYLIRLGLGQRPCELYSADARVRVEATDRTTYPDLSVVCGKVQHASDDENAIVNPTVLVEVLSESTERSDREKFAHYQHLSALKEYVLISQESKRVEVFLRGDARSWILKTFLPGERVTLESINVSFEVDALYADSTA